MNDIERSHVALGVGLHLTDEDFEAAERLAAVGDPGDLPMFTGSAREPSWYDALGSTRRHAVDAREAGRREADRWLTHEITPDLIEGAPREVARRAIAHIENWSTQFDNAADVRHVFESTVASRLGLD